jgi:hypothetical protein
VGRDGGERGANQAGHQNVFQQAKLHRVPLFVLVARWGRLNSGKDNKADY